MEIVVDTGTDLVKVLKANPCGTYDRLLGLMLKRRATHFIVPFGG
jgi:hypothetical protein